MVVLYKRLYKQDTTGSIRVWGIYHNEENTAYWTLSGKIDGRKVQSGNQVVVPKVNRTQREQILLEMNSKVSSKKTNKYVESIKDIGEKADNALPGYSAMLAKKYEDQFKKVRYPCAVQPKLDGIRCLATKDGLFSRGRKPIESCRHIYEALGPLFAKYPNLELDGELYANEFKSDFEKIIKAVRKTDAKAKPEDLLLQAKISYFVYDCPTINSMTREDMFISRYNTLVELIRHEKSNGMDLSCITVVKTNICSNENEIHKRMSQYVLDGYEGLMVRNTSSPYQGKRTSDLLKMKNFKEGEYLIVRLKEGKGHLAGHAGSLVCRTKEGNEFNAKLEGSFLRLKAIWENPGLAVGKVATIRYFELTNAERVPRFCTAKDIRGLPNGSDWY